MSRYAQGMSVSVDKSEADIRRLLQRYGADQIEIGTSAAPAKAGVKFNYLTADRRRLPVRIIISLPNPSNERFALTPSGRRRRSAEDSYNEWRKACRQQWRVLMLLIQAQLEGILNGIVTPEEAFLPWLVLASGQTVGQWAETQFAVGGTAMLPALPAPPTSRSRSGPRHISAGAA